MNLQSSEAFTQAISDPAHDSGPWVTDGLINELVLKSCTGVSCLLLCQQFLSVWVVL